MSTKQSFSLSVRKNIQLTLTPSRVAVSLYVCVSCLFPLDAVDLAAQSRPATGDLPGTGPERAAEFLVQYRDKAMKRWSQSIEALEQRDVEQGDPKDAILFIGSSSIRRWDTIEIDMTPYQVVQRGYGGAKYTDLAVFAKRLILPHEYSALVVFVANDVQGKSEDHSPEQVEECARYIAAVSRKHRPRAPIFFIEITPTRKRFSAWPSIRKVNTQLQKLSLSTPGAYFIPTADHFLDPSGNPRDELFVDDQLHLNGDGYKEWSSLIRQELDGVLQ
ncbi:MAG: GDSL-type esterase/lipase family protein [Pirellulales bacterium]